MEELKESAPFIIGLFLPLPLLFIVRSAWSSLLKFVMVFGSAVVVGFFVSLIMGELIGNGIPEGIMALVIDSSLVYAASQIAYRFFWQPVVKPRLLQDGNSATVGNRSR